MAHQTQLEKAKYRNWVKGALSMKYLRDGLEKFTEDNVQNEHTRILQQIGITTGLTCTGCSLRDLKPVHTSVYDSTTKRKSCPRGQNNCNCLYPNKASCPNKICGAIYEEILNTHASSPPSPCLKNTDITKWATHPWEIAKCFINAPGYRDRQSVEEIDLAGLLHIFINNTMFQTSLSCLIAGDKRDAFCKVLDLRNKIFHSPYMELEEQDLSECFRNILIILEDEKNLKQTQCAKEAVKLIQELQNQDFIITTETEVMILRDIIEQRVNAVEVSNIEQVKEHSKLDERHSQLAKGHAELEKKHGELKERHSGLDEKYSEVAKVHSELEEKHNELEKRHSRLEKTHSKLEEGHLELDGRHKELEKRQSGIEQKHSELANGHSELKEKNKELENIYLGLEQKHTEHEQRLVRMESDVDKLQDLHKNQLTTAERRLGARRKLADHLQKYYVKTSVSPLKTRQNEIDIDKVYVPPKIEIVKNESSENEKNKDLSNDKPKFVKTYSSIFHSHGKRLRRIYLLGEVGSGKSVFCKMMILNWCRSVTKQTDQAICKDELKNNETMKQFDFLFFLPLRRLQGNGRIREMINWYYKDLISVEILDDILLNVPEKCVILADGLDEWAPNLDEERPLHVTDGLPYLEDIEEATVLTTSRPSASGVLNMAFTESDQKLVVKGIHSIELMAKKYMLLINHMKSDSKFVLNHLYAIKIGQLEESPLLLQQLVWMLGNGYKVGKCMSNVYSSLVNIALRWAEDKCSKKKIKSERSCISFSELHLPKQLLKYDACRANRNILFTLGKIAFELLAPENNCDSQMSFGRGKLNEDGLDDDMIDTVLSIGLLTEDNRHDNIEHRTQLAFAHATFQEYFVALYVASHSQIGQNQSSDAQKRLTRECILERLFKNSKYSVQNIVQLAVVLQLLCGLAPEIIYDVCEYVYQIAQQDSTYSSLRDTYLLKELGWSFRDKYISITLDMHKLISNCIFEYNCNEETRLSALPVLDLAFVFSTRNQNSGLLQYINPQKVLHVSLSSRGNKYYEGDEKTYIKNVVFQNLQTLAIDWDDICDSNFITAVLFRHLYERLSVRKCKIVSFYNDKCLINLSGHHQLELLNTDWGVVNVDLTKVEVIRYANRYSSSIIQGGVAPELRHLEVCYVNMFKRQLKELAKFISGNVYINVIKLYRISCNLKVDVKPSTVTLIDLSSHDNLQVLKIVAVDLISIKYVNTTNLHTVTTDRTDVLHAVRNAPKLLDWNFFGHISFTVPYTKEMNEDACSCSQLQEIELSYVTIQDEAFEMSCGMRNLTCIKLYMVKMSLNGWIRFVDSLLNLKQSVTVRYNSQKGNLGEELNYIKRNNNKFDLIKYSSDVWHYLEFETLP